MLDCPFSAQALAHEFARLLWDDLGMETMTLVLLRNKRPEYAGACASHDFCDANMVMVEAVKNLFGSKASEACLPPDDENDHSAQAEHTVMVDLWNQAWDIAKDSQFAQ